MYILPDLLVKQVILALEGDTTIYPAGMLLHLYVNNLTPTKTTPLASFTELTNVEVPGYAAVPITWDGTPSRNQDGSWEDFANDAAFIGTTGPPSPQIVYGWFMTNAGGTVLVGAGLLALPFTFTQPGDGLRLENAINANQTDGETITVQLLVEQS
jgi:hypothetical protein